MKVGVLALQGAFREHTEVLGALGAEPVEVRRADQLATVGALVLPGGESTTVDRLLRTSGMRAALVELLTDGLPVLGTCAGLIVLGSEVVDGRPDQRPLGLIDCTVRRNGYGRQQQSFEAELAVSGLGGGRFPGVFIRAPRLERVGPDVEVLARHDGLPVLVRAGPRWGTCFHPELAGDLRLHQRFLNEVS